ncbi:MAG: hypothetical protein WBW32_13105, partial [Luteibacter sp.]
SKSGKLVAMPTRAARAACASSTRSNESRHHVAGIPVRDVLNSAPRDAPARPGGMMDSAAWKDHS